MTDDKERGDERPHGAARDDHQVDGSPLGDDQVGGLHAGEGQQGSLQPDDYRHAEHQPHGSRLRDAGPNDDQPDGDGHRADRHQPRCADGSDGVGQDDAAGAAGSTPPGAFSGADGRDDRTPRTGADSRDDRLPLTGDDGCAERLPRTGDDGRDDRLPAARGDIAGDELQPAAVDEVPLDDPALRASPWVLALGAVAAAGFALVQAVAEGSGAPVGYGGVAALAILAAALVREARRRTVTGRYLRAEVHEFALPLALFLVTLVLMLHGAGALVAIPALVGLLPVAWEIAHPARAERSARLLPHALPVLQDGDEEAAETRGEVAAIVRDVLDALPPDIDARLKGWSVEVRDELLPRPRDEIVYGMCFGGANVIAIYERPHVREARRGEPLRRAVTYTLLHEIGHALGLDEIGVRRLGPLSDEVMRRRRDAEEPRGTP